MDTSAAGARGSVEARPEPPPRFFFENWSHISAFSCILTHFKARDDIIFLAHHICLSVRLSVCHTGGSLKKMVQARIMQFSP